MVWIPCSVPLFRSKGGGVCGGTAPAGSSSLASFGKLGHYTEDHYPIIISKIKTPRKSGVFFVWLRRLDLNQRPSGYELRFVCGGETFRLIFAPSSLGKPRSEALFVPLIPWTPIPVWVRVWVRIRENPKVIFPLETACLRAEKEISARLRERAEPVKTRGAKRLI